MKQKFSLYFLYSITDYDPSAFGSALTLGTYIGYDKDFGFRLLVNIFTKKPLEDKVAFQIMFIKISDYDCSLLDG